MSPVKEVSLEMSSVAYVPGGIDVASVIAFRAASALFVDALELLRRIVVAAGRRVLQLPII